MTMEDLFLRWCHDESENEEVEGPDLLPLMATSALYLAMLLTPVLVKGAIVIWGWLSASD